MNPLNPLPALAAILIFLACGWLLGRSGKPVPAHGRFGAIDGLRGFLAFFVFLHHSAYWFFYVRNGQWGGIDSHLYRHFGESSVMLFFMITSFLFGSKLLDARDKPIDWRRLYIGRVMRLTPLYLFAMAVLFLLVAIISGFSLQAPLGETLQGAAVWLGFTIFGQPDLNGVAQTTDILAGVTWSLPFEWFLYLSLPAVGLLLGRRSPLVWIIVGLAGAAIIASQQSNALPFKSFVGGLVAAFAVRWPALRARLTGTAAGLLAIVSIAAAVVFFPGGYSRPTLPLMSIAFVIIACGNTLFGLLASNAARVLGDMGYSLYLLHGAVLSVAFRFVIGLDAARELSPIQHWLVILCCVPVLVALCAATYRLVEVPGMAAGQRFDAWMKRRSAA